MRFKVLQHSSGIEEIVNPIAPYARSLRDRALVIDTETTGSSADDEVIELAVVRALDGHVFFDGRFKPSKQIEPFAFRVHRIRDSDLRGKPRMAERYDELCAILSGATCLAWNSSYDSRLITQTFRKYDLSEPHIDWVCAMALYKKWRGLPKNPKLEDACRALHVRQGDHSAVKDALAAARVIYRIAQSAPADEVIGQAPIGAGDADETTMPASEFLSDFGWREQKRIGEFGAVISEWIDPESGQIYPFIAAMSCQRERMMK
jgi:DNA polymerase III epsilon subunit-like protein